MALIKLLSFKSLGDERGNLISLEQKKNVPFEIKRVYYLFNTDKGVTRGFHAHKTLQQVAICVKGSCLFTLDNGCKRETVKLDDPTVGLYIGNNLWREMSEFTYDCVLMVIASELYDENDYIRDYDQFLKEVSL